MDDLGNVTPAGVYLRWATQTLAERDRIKCMNIANRYLKHRLRAAQPSTQIEQSIAF